MKSNRFKILTATLCLFVSGAITLYNVGVFDSQSSTKADARARPGGDRSEAAPAGSLPVDIF